MRFRMLVASCALAAAVFAAPATASTLTLNGGTSAQVDMGDPLTIAISGTPNVPLFLLYDVLPGPTNLFGQSIGLGFTPFVNVINLGVMPPAGNLAFPILVPQLPIATSATVYLVAVLADPAAPFGLDFSNGTSLTIVNSLSAGAPQGTLVGHEVVLGSAGLANLVGEILPNVTVSWTLVQAPPGSIAIVKNPTKPYPTLTPDKPGDYFVDASIVKDGIGYVFSTTVHAWRISLPSLPNGSIVPGDLNVPGLIEGPLPVTLTIDAQPVSVDANGQFGPVSFTFPPNIVHAGHKLQVKAPDNSGVVTKFTAIVGQKATLISDTANSLLANLTQSGLDRISDVVEFALTTADIKGAIVSAPQVELVKQLGPFGNVLFSAYADVTNITYTPVFNVVQNATATGFATTVGMTNVKVTVKISGQVLTVPYSITGIASMNTATFSGLVKLTPNGSTLNVTITAQGMTFSGFSLSLPGFPGSGAQLTSVSNALSPYLANQFKSSIAAKVAAIVKSTFQSVVSTVKFHPSVGVTLDLSGQFAQVTHVNGSVGFKMSSSINVPVPKPGAPIITEFLSNATSPPTIPSTGPLGQAYDFASALADDFMNKALAAATYAGMLEGQAVTLLSGSGVTVSLSAGQLAAIFPQAGFERFDPNLAVSVGLHGTVMPVATPTPLGPAMMHVDVLGLELVLTIATSYGSIPMMRIAIDGSLEVDVEQDTDGGMKVTIVNSTANLSVMEAFPGVEVTLLDPSDIGLLVELQKTLKAIPQMLKDFHLPSFGDAAQFCINVAKSVIGSLKEYVVSFGNFL